jgi:Family of unknown function (DUF6527)
MCPGCEELHEVTVRADGQNVGPAWGYNGNPDAPTFTPSILVRGTRTDLSDDEWDDLMRRTNGERDAMLADRRTQFVCHSFVTDGRIQFLGDCTHALAGQTVDLPVLE